MAYNNPLKYYIDDDDEALTFHLLNVGEGLMILIIFPNDTTMLFDCNVTEENREAIIQYLSDHIPYRLVFSEDEGDIEDFEQKIDVYVNSHRDRDHYRGLRYINEKFEILSIWDSGETGATTSDSDYEYYMRLRRTLINDHGDNAVIVPVPSLFRLANFGEVRVYCLSSSEEYSELIVEEEFSKAMLKEAKIQHKNAIVLTLQYAGKSILITSDSDWKAWRDKIVPNFISSGLIRNDILIASHHGSRSFFTDEINDSINEEANPETTYIDSIRYIDPTITLIPCGEYSQYHHPNKDAVKIYKEYTDYRQVYTTNEKNHFVGYIHSNGRWGVMPTRFKSSRRGSGNFRIKCIEINNGISTEKQSGENFYVGSQLEFSILASYGLLDPIDKVRVYWEVSNIGINSDEKHQDIYYKPNTESYSKLMFRRGVSYEGKHLLRCRIKNTEKQFDVTRIFIVNGVRQY